MPNRPQSTTALSRRKFIATCAASVAGVALAADTTTGAAPKASPSPHPSDARPNILWVLSDDQCPELGCYGYANVKTPNIDRLASEGARFAHAFTTAPVCSASRSALITGMYQTTIGAHNHRSCRQRPLPAGARIVMDYFRQADYYTVLLDKSEVGEIPKRDWNFKVEGTDYDGSDWRARRDGQPFFAMCNIFEPHRLFSPPVDAPVDPDQVKLPSYYPDHPTARKDWAAYLDAINCLDAKIGRLLDRLRADGLLDNTIIFFMGDNGRPFPRCKQFLYEGGIHVPLIVYAPERFRSLVGFDAGAVRNDLVSAIDLAPTSLRLAGIDVPPAMQGNVFLGAQARERDAIYAARDRCDETVDRIRCVRTRRFKYIRNFFPDRAYTQLNRYKEWNYPILPLMRDLDAQGALTPAQARFLTPTRPAEELYDLDKDPDELENVALSADYAADRARLSEMLDRWIVETDDQGRFPEDPSVIAEQEAAMIAAFEGNPKAWEK